eukprot:sb/3478736/
MQHYLVCPGPSVCITENSKWILKKAHQSGIYHGNHVTLNGYNCMIVQLVLVKLSFGISRGERELFSDIVVRGTWSTKPHVPLATTVTLVRPPDQSSQG